MRRSVLLASVTALILCLAVPVTDASRFGSRSKRKKAKKAKVEQSEQPGLFQLESGLVAQMPAVQEALGWIDQEPSNPKAWQHLGVTLANVGDVPDALRAFENALELDPQDIETWVDLGAAHMRAKDFRRAISALEEAEELEPYHARMHYNLALALLETGEYDRALDSFEAALLLEPALGDPKKNPGVVNIPDLDIVRLRVYMKTAGASPSLFSR